MSFTFGVFIAREREVTHNVTQCIFTHKHARARAHTQFIGVKNAFETKMCTKYITTKRGPASRL